MAKLPDATGRFVIECGEDPPRSRFEGSHISTKRGSPPDRFVEVPEAVREWLQQIRADELRELGEAMTFFSRLPPETRNWMKQLRADDVREIQEAMEFVKSARIVGRFGKWMIGTAVVTFGTAWAASEKIAAAWRWFTGAAP